MTDTAGTITDTYFYTAFGEELAKTGTTENEFRYVGEQWDPNAGFYYLRARWYDQSTGRFASVDSYAGDPQAPVSLHRYLYGNSSPVSNSDPSGYVTLFELEMSSIIRGIVIEHYCEATNRFFNSIAKNEDLGSDDGSSNDDDDDPQSINVDLPEDDVLKAGAIVLLVRGSPALFTVMRKMVRVSGVYVLKTSGGGYIGQSVNMGRRVSGHFGKSGKLNRFVLRKSSFYKMQGSSPKEREIYEQYLITKSGGPGSPNATINKVNPMGGRKKEYSQDLMNVIMKYNLPL